MGQGWREGGTVGNYTETFHAFSEHITHPAPPNILQPGSSLKPHCFRVFIKVLYYLGVID